MSKTARPPDDRDAATDSYAQFEGVIDQAAQDAGVQDVTDQAAQEAASQAQETAGQMVGQAQQAAGQWGRYRT